MEKVHGVLIIFGFDITSSSRTDNRRNNFLVLGEGPTDFINDSTVAATKKKKIVLILGKQMENFA